MKDSDPPSVEENEHGEERWIECEHVQQGDKNKSHVHINNNDEEEEDITSAYYSLFTDPDPYEIFQFELYPVVPQGEEDSKRSYFLQRIPHTLQNHDTCSIHNPQTLQLRGIKPENGQLLHSTGLTLWRAAYHLCDFLSSHCPTHHTHWLQDKSILELGAGLGLCGLFVSYFQQAKQIVMTDGDSDTLMAMRYNVHHMNPIQSSDSEKNSMYPVLRTRTPIHCHQLQWGNHKQIQSILQKYGPFPILIASDIIYVEDILEPLFDTVVQLLSRSIPTLENPNETLLRQEVTLSTLLSCSVSIFLLAYARRNVKIDLVLECAQRHGLAWIEPKESEGVYVFYFRVEE